MWGKRLPSDSNLWQWGVGDTGTSCVGERDRSRISVLPQSPAPRVPRSRQQLFINGGIRIGRGTGGTSRSKLNDNHHHEHS